MIRGWISVKDRLPETEEGFKRCSRSVLVKLSDGREIEAFLETENCVWYKYMDGCSKIPGEQVVAWREI